MAPATSVSPEPGSPQQLVPLETVRAVLIAYLEHGGMIPEDFPDLQVLEEE